MVFLTALGGDSERLLGYQLGVDAYIPKPYEPEEVVMRVRQIVRRARNAQTSPAARTTLRGEIEHVSAASLLSFLELDRKSGVLLVIGTSVARLFVRDGRVLRAKIEGQDNLSAREALMTVVDWQRGQFEFSPQDLSDDQDEIGASIAALLLEHARRTDEGER